MKIIAKNGCAYEHLFDNNYMKNMMRTTLLSSKISALVVLYHDEIMGYSKHDMNKVMYPSKIEYVDWILSYLYNNNATNVLSVIYEKDVVIGFCISSIFAPVRKNEKNILGIEHLYISKEYRNKGIGKDFLNNIIETLSKLYNCGSVKLNVHSTNEYAIKLYTNIGFKIFSHTMIKTNVI